MMCCFLIWLDEDDADIVEELDVDTWALLLVCPIMFFISAIEFCISPRPCLMAAAELDELELEDCFEEEDAVSEEDMRRCVEDVLAIRDVVVELDEDTLLLELLLLLRSFFVIFLSRLLFSLKCLKLPLCFTIFRFLHLAKSFLRSKSDHKFRNFLETTCFSNIHNFVTHAVHNFTQIGAVSRDVSVVQIGRAHV